MATSIDDITTKAVELSRLIQSCPIAQRFHETLKALAGDKNAQRILEQLFAYGHNVSMGLTVESLTSSEYARLKEELDGTPLVKKHLMNQREYLNLLGSIMNCINNPR